MQGLLWQALLQRRILRCGESAITDGMLVKT